LETASERQLSSIAFTEHVRRTSDWFTDFAKNVREKAQGYGNLQVYVGCEAKALDYNGLLDVSDQILAECDIVLGSVHSFPDGDGGYLDFGNLDPETFAEMECELALGLLKNAPIHVLAHPGGMYSRKLDRPFPERLFRRILEVSLERGIAVEINSSYLKDFQAFLKLCSEMNPYVSIGSDVHRLDEIGRCRDLLRELGKDFF
jgi:putative hydrolase